MKNENTRISFILQGGYDESGTSDIVMLAPVFVHTDYFRQGIGKAMLEMSKDKKNIEDFVEKLERL